MLLAVQEFSRDHGPRLKVALAIKSGKESIFLPPDQIVILLTHADAVDEVEMGEGNDSDCVKVLNEREAITESAIVDVIAHTADRLGQLILLDFAVE